MSVVKLRESLTDHSLFEREINTLQEKYSRSFRLFDSQLYNGVNFATIVLHKQSFIRALIHDVSRAEFAFDPARLGTLHIGGKARTTYMVSIVERIVHGVIHRILSPHVLAQVPKEVYSYRPGTGRHHALEAVGRYVRDYRQRVTNPKKRTLYVMRADIKKYGESIPVHPGSRLWAQLETINGEPFSESDKWWLEQAIRPDIQSDEGGVYCPRYGIPDGLPISSLLLNLYAQPLDEQFAGIEGGCYARFGDDILLVHPDKKVIKKAQKTLLEMLAALELSVSEEKLECYAWNGSGTPVVNWQTTSRIEFLGSALDFNGHVVMKPAKKRAMLRELKGRLAAAKYNVPKLSSLQKAHLLSDLTNDMMRRNGVAPVRHLDALLMVTDRGELHDIDYQIARMIAELAAGNRGVRAFRDVPYRYLRETCGLASHEHARRGWLDA